MCIISLHAQSYSATMDNEKAAARIQAAQRRRLARLAVERRRRSLIQREATARWEREEAAMKIQVRANSNPFTCTDLTYDSS